MQYWIFFITGAGGDGFANLLEHAKSVTTIDYDNKQCWRIHQIVDDSVKFWAPSIDSVACFRQNKPFHSNNNSLSACYIDIVNQNVDTIVTSHDVHLQAFDASECREIFEKNQIKIYIKSPTPVQTAQQGNRMNLRPWRNINYNLQKNVDESRFDHVVDLNEITSNWDNFSNWCSIIGLTVPQTSFDEYCKIRSGDSTLIPNWIARYQSRPDQTFVEVDQKI